jgi:transposase
VPDADNQREREIDEWRERAERAERERDRLQRERDQLQREHEQLQRERERLRREVDRLKRQLDEARRAAHRQAAPFAKGLTPHPRRPGRKAGAQYGRKARRRRPRRIDETYDAPLPEDCPHCGGTIRKTRVAVQYQEELPVPRVIVRAFRIHIGQCCVCQRRVQGRHPLQTSDALGAASAQLGAQVVAFAVILNKQLGLSFGKIATLFQQQYGLTITRSGLVHAVHRAARQARPTYTALCQRVRGSPVVTPDETGWKVAGRLHWLWAVATPDTTVYRIQAGRGYPEAARLLGRRFAGIIVRDGWAPYRRFDRALHQTCLAHLLRRAKQLHADHPRAGFSSAVREGLQRALALRDRYLAGQVSAHGLAVARGRLLERLNRLLDRPGTVADVRRFAAHLATEWPALFTFLFDATTIDATNWRAEHALRPAIVTRKVCGGNRSQRGAETQQILASVLRTAHQRQLDVQAVLVSLLHARTPTVVRDLQNRAR